MTFKTIDEANQAVIDKITEASPFLLDVVRAKEVIPALNKRMLLHAGPPMTWDDMTDPMQGSCVGAVLFEEWAETEEEARELLSSGAIGFEPCHHHQAVGPMGGSPQRICQF